MPRVPLIDRDDLADEDKPLWDEIVRVRGTMVTSFRSLFNSPGLVPGVSRLGGYLRFESTVDDRARELAVLVINRDLRCEFGWIQHEIIVRGMGVPQSVIDDIRDGRVPEDVTPADRGAMVAAHEACSLGAVTPQTLTDLFDLFGKAGAVDLVVAIGYYTMLAQYFRAMELVVEPELLKSLQAASEG